MVGISLYAVAVGLDCVEGLPDKPCAKIDIADFFSTHDGRIKHMSKALEEFLEMLGTTISLTIFLKNLFILSREWKFNIKEAIFKFQIRISFPLHLIKQLLSARL